MFEKLKTLICNYVEVAPGSITEGSRFIEDLGFDSFTFMSMLGEAEETFGITVDEAEIINLSTVGDAVKYLEGLTK